MCNCIFPVKTNDKTNKKVNISYKLKYLGSTIKQEYICLFSEWRILYFFFSLPKCTVFTYLYLWTVSKYAYMIPLFKIQSGRNIEFTDSERNLLNATYMTYQLTSFMTHSSIIK